jgi:hypothetical protein
MQRSSDLVSTSSDIARWSIKFCGGGLPYILNKLVYYYEINLNN